MHPVPDRLRNHTRIPCQRHDLPASTSDRQIFYYLGVGHVFFNREKRWLYFSDLGQTPVIPVLENLCRNGRNDYVFETLYLDVHQYFFGGYRLRLPEDLCKPLLVALRMKGVMISYMLEAESPATGLPPLDSLPG